MKTIGIVQKLITLAAVRADNNGNKGTGIAVTKRNGREVYRVQFEKGGLAGDTAVLYHYGTPTAEVWLSDTPQLLDVYGESRSDADSVNTFLAQLGIDKRYTYKPVNGGFMEVE